MRKTMLRLALATALTAGLAVGLPVAAQAAPTAATTATQAVQGGGDWGGWRHHRRFGFGRFGFPIVSPFFLSPWQFGGGFGFGGFDDCWDGGGFFDHAS